MISHAFWVQLKRESFSTCTLMSFLFGIVLRESLQTGDSISLCRFSTETPRTLQLSRGLDIYPKQYNQYKDTHNNDPQIYRNNPLPWSA